MKSTGTDYNWVRSFERLDEILDASDTDYRERDDLPARDSLTYKNGFYVKAAALFIDIRKSTDLPSKYTFPQLARLYRAFISELVAVLDGDENCDEVNIVGDGVWGVFDCRYKNQLNGVVDTAAAASSLIDKLNEKLMARGYDRIYVGIGISWGRVMMLKSGFSGSGISDIVYMGNVVNGAAKLCSYGQAVNSQGRYPRIVADSDFVTNLNSGAYKKFFTWNVALGAFTSSLVNSSMIK